MVLRAGLYECLNEEYVYSDVEKYQEGIGEKVPMFVYLVMSFVTAVLISFAYGWELTLVILSCAPIIIATTAIVAKVSGAIGTVMT